MTFAKITGLFIVLFVNALYRSDLPGQEVNLTVIVEEQTDNYIKGAVVKLVSLDRVLQLQSGADGKILFTHLTPGAYDLEVSAYGFNSKKIRNLQVPLANAEPLEITLSVKVMECGRLHLIDYVNSEPHGFPISGHVINEDKNKPISKAQVHLSKAGENRVLATARSDKQGEFTFEDLPPGRYDIHVQKDFYRPAYVMAFLVPRESSAKLTIFLDTTDHIHICQ